MKSRPPIITVVSPAFATRLAPLTYSAGSGCPSISPETIDHSPSSRSLSSLAASAARPAPARRQTANATITLLMTTPFLESIRAPGLRASPPAALRTPRSATGAAFGRRNVRRGGMGADCGAQVLPQAQEQGHLGRQEQRGV